MKKIALCLLALSCSQGVFAACAMPTTNESWTLFAEINGYRSIVGSGNLVVAPTGIIDITKSSMTLIWNIYNNKTYTFFDIKKSVPLSGKLAIDAKCNVTGIIKTKNPDIIPEIQFNFIGKQDTINKNLVNGIFYHLNTENVINGKITAMKN